MDTRIPHIPCLAWVPPVAPRCTLPVAAAVQRVPKGVNMRHAGVYRCTKVDQRDGSLGVSVSQDGSLGLRMDPWVLDGSLGA